VSLTEKTILKDREIIGGRTLGRFTGLSSASVTVYGDA